MTSSLKNPGSVGNELTPPRVSASIDRIDPDESRTIGTAEGRLLEPGGLNVKRALDVLGDAQEELRDQLDSEVQTISNVIEASTVVEYWPERFPDLASLSP